MIGLGGGSSLDCAKGINFLLTNGGAMADYRGYGKAATPLLPMIGVPTTAGTGSEAQSYAVISDAATHMKMACGDPSAAVRVAMLDPELTVDRAARRDRDGRFRRHRACGRNCGHDAADAAVGHVLASRLALLSDAYRRVLEQPDDWRRGRRCIAGAHFAGDRDRAVDARRRPRVRESADGRHDLAHGVALAPAAACRAWNGVRRRRAATRRCSVEPCGRPATRCARDDCAGRLEALAIAGGLAGRCRDTASRRARCRS